MKNKFFLILTLVLLSGCTDNNLSKQDISQDYSMSMAILYNYYSAEYSALTIQAYNLAVSKLDYISDTASSVKQYAVVVDIDETVLDNSPYQARAIVENFSYPDGWNEWCNKSEARAIPGALMFLNYADSLGFKIFYISNRKQEFVYKGTFKNLETEGFPQVDDKSIMLRLPQSEQNPYPSDKEIRREKIREMGYEIVLLAGDNLGDFYTDDKSGMERKALIEANSKEFGNKYIVLPNAMYGNWPSSIGLDGTTVKTMELLKEMSKY